MLYYKHANALIALMPQGGQRFELLVAAVKLGDSVLADPSEYDAALLPITAAMHTVIGRCCCHPVAGGSPAHQRPATGPPAMSILLKRPREDEADAITTASPTKAATKKKKKGGPPVRSPIMLMTGSQTRGPQVVRQKSLPHHI